MRTSRSVLVGVLLAVCLLAPRPAAAQEDGPVYIVQEGDTLTGIALRFGVSVEDLASANGLADPSAIFPGMSLRLPGFEGVSGVLQTLPVGAGENLESLSLRYSVDPEALGRLNRLVNRARLYVGQPLIVPVAESPTGLPAAELVFPEQGTGALQLAARSGSNPWLLDRLNDDEERLWLVSDNGVYLPGSETATDALPESIRSVRLDPARPGQGHTVVVEVGLEQDGALTGSLGERMLNFMAESDEARTHVALQGIHALAEPGLVDLSLAFAPAAGPAFAFTQPVRIEAEEYYRENVRVPDETLDPANTVPEDKLIASVLSPASPDRLWNGPLEFPTGYFDTFPSFFGTRRNYNDTGWNYYHTGLDLYGGEETEIYAPAPGVVVFAAPLTVRGNTTYIDHGWGVYTGYLHQSQLLVEPGDRVETGDLIGMVGATGRVTGPHLHWEIWVGGVPVEPLDWTSRSYPSSSDSEG